MNQLPHTLRVSVFALLLFSAGAGCEGQHYVDAQTVSISVTRDSTPVALLMRRCHYVPVLLGSEVRARHVVDDQLAFELRATQHEVVVSFEGAEDADAGVRVDAEDLSDDFAQEFPITSAGVRYTVGIESPCDPD